MGIRSGQFNFAAIGSEAAPQLPGLYRSVDPALDINAVADRMVEKGWFVGRSIEPSALYMALNPVVGPAVADYRRGAARSHRAHHC